MALYANNFLCKRYMNVTTYEILLYIVSPNYTLNWNPRYIHLPSAFLPPLFASMEKFSRCCEKSLSIFTCPGLLFLSFFLSFSSVRFIKAVIRFRRILHVRLYRNVCLMLYVYRNILSISCRNYRDEMVTDERASNSWSEFLWRFLSLPRERGFRCPAKRSVLGCKFFEKRNLSLSLSLCIVYAELRDYFSISFISYVTCRSR